MSNVKALMICVLAGCLDREPEPDPCGPMPPAPGSVVNFDRGVVTMPAPMWSAHSRWADAIQPRGNCEASR